MIGDPHQFFRPPHPTVDRRLQGLPSDKRGRPYVRPEGGDGAIRRAAVNDDERVRKAPCERPISADPPSSAGAHSTSDGAG